MNIPRFIAIPVILVGVGVFAYGVYQQGQTPMSSQAPSRVVSVQKLQDAGAIDAPVELSTEMPTIQMPPHEARGRVIHVRGEWPRAGEGTQTDPYHDLASALCTLRPGDRLIIWPGQYLSPISVGDDCQAGTADEPIEVVMSAGAHFYGKEGMEAPIDQPGLSIGQSHWHFYNLEVEPHWMRPAIHIQSGVRDVLIDDAHIMKGVGDGILIDEGASNIRVVNTHLHHLGTLRGAKRDFRDPSKSGVTIGLGVRDVALINLQVHHMEGGAYQVVGPTGLITASEALEALGIVVEGLNATLLHGNWE